MSEVWEILGGNHFKHVTLNNLRIFLFAVQNILVEHGAGVDDANL